jgi:hypothetical protein
MPQDLGAPLEPIAIPGPPTPQDSPLAVNMAELGGSGCRAGLGGVSVANPADPAPLPCPPTCNNSNEQVAFPAAAARTAFALKLNVQTAVERWGLAQSGFFTLTFAEHILDPKEAQRRLNSLMTGVLRERYGECIRVYERQESGRIHYHLLVNVGADIRTGVDFAAIKRKDYRTASPALRAEWAFWRRTAKLYGFGRTELLPIISTSAAIGRYVGGYIAKHLTAREERDKGVRLVSYSGPRVATVKFAWAEGGGRAWRVGLEALVRDLAAAGQIDAVSTEAMRRRFGKRWAWDWRDIVAQRAREAGIDRSTGEILGGV